MQPLNLLVRIDSRRGLRLFDQTPAWVGQADVVRYRLTAQYVGLPEAYWEKDGSSRGELRQMGFVVSALDLAARTGMAPVDGSLRSGRLRLTLSAVAMITTSQVPTDYLVELGYQMPTNSTLQVRVAGGRWEDVTATLVEGSSRWLLSAYAKEPYKEWQLLLGGLPVDKGTVFGLLTALPAVTKTEATVVGYTDMTLIIVVAEREQWANLVFASIGKSPCLPVFVLPGTVDDTARLGYIGAMLDTIEAGRYAEAETGEKLWQHVQTLLCSWPI